MGLQKIVWLIMAFWGSNDNDMGPTLNLDADVAI